MTTDEMFANAWRHHQAGEHHQAEESYRSLLREEPRNGQAWFELGRLCAEQDRTAEAAACIRQALELEPHEPMGWLHLGNTLLRLDMTEEAEQAYRQCLQLPDGKEGDGTKVDALVNLAFLLGNLKRYDEARTFYEKARAINPHRAEVHDRGDIVRELGTTRPVKKQRLLVEVSAGELLDKLSILRIKSQRITDTDKRRNVEVEKTALSGVRQSLPNSKELDELEEQLQRVNERLWDIEDAIRDCERNADFGQRFIELARSVYKTNDRRSEIKRAINELLGSAIVEEKSYTQY